MFIKYHWKFIKFLKKKGNSINILNTWPHKDNLDLEEPGWVHTKG